MIIILKHTLKNIVKKPLRTLLLVICILFCTFSALLCLDMKGTLQNLLKNLFSQAVGDSDIIVSDRLGLDESILEDNLECRYVMVAQTEGGVTVPIEGQYTFFHTKSFIVYGMNSQNAYDLRLLPSNIELTKSDIVINQKMSQELKLQAGDTVTLYDNARNEVFYTVKEVVPDTGMLNGRSASYISRDGFCRLRTDGSIRYQFAYADVFNEEDIPAVMKTIEERDFRAEVENIFKTEDMKMLTEAITKICFLMFLICFLLVIFVTSSVTSRIICERMSVVGTLRSLGVSSTKTSFILFLENGLYGLIGGVLGCLLYSAVRGLILGGMITVESSAMNLSVDYGNTSFWVYLIAVLGAILVECLCPVKRILAASKTPIRDIIFDNKDTEYKISKTSIGVGLLLTVTAVITLLIQDSYVSLTVCFISMVFAVALLFPLILKFFAYFISKLSEKNNHAVLKLAATECYARKSTVGSSVLCITTSLLAILLMILVLSTSSIYQLNTYDCDLHVSTNNIVKSSMLTYIKDLKGVSGTDKLYHINKNVQIGEVSAKEFDSVNIFGMPEGGFKYLTGITGLPKSLAKDEMVLDRQLAEANGFQPGDEVTVTFDLDSFLPATKTLKFIGYCDSYGFDTTAKSIVIAESLYVDIFHDYPGEILVRCDNPNEIKAQIEKYSGSIGCTVETVEEYRDNWNEKSSGMKRLLTLVIMMGVGLTVIGMVSNQLIGFEGRKRECAVLVSCVMSKPKVSRLFILESMLAYGIALITAFIASFPMFWVFRRLFHLLSGSIPLHNSLSGILIFLAVLWIVFTLVSVFPIRCLKKMKPAAVLKYE